MKTLPGSKKKGFWQRAGELVKGTLMPWTYSADIQRDNMQEMICHQQYLQEKQLGFQAQVEERREELALSQMKLQYVMQQQRQEFNSGQAIIIREFQASENYLIPIDDEDTLIGLICGWGWVLMISG